MFFFLLFSCNVHAVLAYWGIHLKAFPDTGAFLLQRFVIFFPLFSLVTSVISFFQSIMFQCWLLSINFKIQTKGFWTLLINWGFQVKCRRNYRFPCTSFPVSWNVFTGNCLRVPIFLCTYSYLYVLCPCILCCTSINMHHTNLVVVSFL